MTPPPKKTNGPGRTRTYDDPCNHNDLQKSIDEKAGRSKVSPTKSEPIPPELARVLEAWPSLPEAVKAGILAMVRASTTGQVNNLRD